MSSLVRQHTKRMVGAAVLALACITSACVSPPVTPETRAESSPKALRMSPGEGMVVVKLATNRPQVSRLFRKFHSIVVWNENQEKEYVLGDHADAWASHGFFAKGLPLGRYTIRDIKSEVSNGMIEGWFRTNPKDVFPSFTVAPGRLTDLGNIVYVRPHGPAASNRHAWAHVHTPHDRADALRQLSPVLAASLGAEPALGWDADTRLQQLQENYAGLRSASMLGNAPVRLGDGTMLFGESFGLIAVRTPSAEWRTLETPTASPIRALHAESNGALFAGSEDALLLMRRSGEQDWTPLALPVDDGTVIDIGPLPGTEELLVVLEMRDRFIGLSTKRASPGEWTRQFSHPRQLFLAPLADARGFVYRARNKLVLATGSPIGRQQALAYDSTVRSWTTATLDVDGAPLTWTMLPDGGLARFEAVPLSRDRFFYISGDGGKRWETRAELHGTWGPLTFVTNDTGYVVRSPGPPELEFPADLKEVASVWRTDDSGRSWKEIGVAPAYPRRLIDLGGPDHLGYVSNDGRFFSTTDGGKTWSLEKKVL